MDGNASGSDLAFAAQWEERRREGRYPGSHSNHRSSESESTCRTHSAGLTYLSQSQRLAELFLERLAHRAVNGRSKFRIGCQDCLSVISRLLQQIEFLGDIRDLHLRQTVLSCAEEFARAAEFQVHF